MDSRVEEFEPDTFATYDLIKIIALCEKELSVREREMEDQMSRSGYED